MKLNIEDLYQITFGEDESYSCFVDAKDISYRAKPLKDKDKTEGEDKK